VQNPITTLLCDIFQDADQGHPLPNPIVGSAMQIFRNNLPDPIRILTDPNIVRRLSEFDLSVSLWNSLSPRPLKIFSLWPGAHFFEMIHLKNQHKTEQSRHKRKKKNTSI
jgi:hypothetical protein